MSYYNKLPISGTAGKHNTGEKVIDGNGRTKVYAYAAAAATKGTPYVMSFGVKGVQNLALSTQATDVYIMVAEKTLSTGEYGWFITEGEVDLTTASDAVGTAGFMFKVHTDGTVVCTDAAFSATAITDFACGMQLEATATTHTVYLLGKTITWA